MFSVGLFDLLFGALMLILLHFKVYRKFSTFLELDYDTPWDNRHISRDMKLRLRLTKDATPVRKSIRRLKDSLWRTSHSSDVPLVDAVSDVLSDVVDPDVATGHSPSEPNPRVAGSTPARVKLLDDGSTVYCAPAGGQVRSDALRSFRRFRSLPRILHNSLPGSGSKPGKAAIFGLEEEADSSSAGTASGSDRSCSDGPDSDVEDGIAETDTVGDQDKEGKGGVVFQFWL